MAIYKLLRQGDQGEDVKKLQNALIAAGHDVGAAGADGIYGQNTAQAVRDYQTKHKLQIDGIAGDETLGMLYGASPENTAQDTAAEAPNSTQRALDQWNAHLSAKPQQPESAWDGYLREYGDALLNRGDFDYDVNEDALYQQLQDQYTAQGRLAMLDTMAQAQQMNGGYGSSYAQSAGQQAYNGYMQSLTDQIPRLYQLARDHYDAQGQALLDKLSLVSQMDQREYDRYTDELSRWLTERDYLRDVYEDARSYEDDRLQDNYTKLLDLMAVGYAPTDGELRAAGMTRVQADSVRSAYAQSGKSTASSGASGKGDDLAMLDYMRLSDLFAKTKSVDELDALRENMLNMGIAADIVFQLYTLARERLRKAAAEKKEKTNSGGTAYQFAKQNISGTPYDAFRQYVDYQDLDTYLKMNN